MSSLNNGQPGDRAVLAALPRSSIQGVRPRTASVGSRNVSARFEDVGKTGENRPSFFLLSILRAERDGYEQARPVSADAVLGDPVQPVFSFVPVSLAAITSFPAEVVEAEADDDELRREAVREGGQRVIILFSE